MLSQYDFISAPRRLFSNGQHKHLVFVLHELRHSHRRPPLRVVGKQVPVGVVSLDEQDFANVSAPGPARSDCIWKTSDGPHSQKMDMPLL